jgi:PAS domain S-box-containing protein
MRTTAPLTGIELLAEVVQGAPEGVTITTADLDAPGPQIVYVNPALCRMTGYEPDELLGESPRILQGARTDREVLDGVRARLAAGEPSRGQTWNYRKDGTEFLMRWRIDPIRGADEAISHFVAFQQDVTEMVLETERRQAAEAADADDRERIRLLMEHLPVVTYTVDRDGSSEQVRYVTGGIKQLTGYTADEWIADSELWFRVVHPDDRADVSEEWHRTIEAGLPYDREYRMVRRDSSVLWVREKAAVTTHEGRTHVDGIFEDVSERRFAQDRLAAAEQRIRHLVEQVPALFYEALPGVAGATLYVSPQILQILGVSPEAYIRDQRWWIEHLHPSDRDRTLEEYERRLDGDDHSGSFSIEYRVVRPDGRTVWISDRVTVDRDGEHHPILVRGCMFDVTAQKVAEANVLHAEAKYQALIEQLPLITYLWELGWEPEAGPTIDPAYYTSPQIESILGYSLEEWDAHPEGWRDMVHPDDRERVLAAVARSEDTGEPFVEEYRYLHKADGHIVWVHDESVLLRRRADGRPWLFQGVMYDITTRVEGDRALQDSLARFRTLAERAPVGIYTADARGRDTYVNVGWCEVTGIDATAAMGSGWTEALHPDDRGRVVTAWNVAVATGEEFAEDFRFVRPDGEVRWVRSRAAPVRDARNELTGFVGTVDDVTQRRATEEQLRLIRSAVEHTDNAVVIAELVTGDEPAPLVYVNPAFTRMTGFSPEEVLGRPTTIVLRGEGSELAARRARLLRGAGEVIHVQVSRKDGSRFSAEGVISPIQDEEGMLSHLVAILRDVTEIQEAERSLRQSLVELRQVDAERRVAMAQIVEAQEQELDRMAEGVEDRSLQQLAAVRMRMEMLRRNVSDPAQLGSLEKLESSVDQAVGQLRGLVTELRPRGFTTQDLEGAIRQYLDRLDGVRSEVRGGVIAEPHASQRSTAFRIVQEFVTSAVDTGTVTSIHVDLGEVSGGFEIRIVDDRDPGSSVTSPTIRDRAVLAGGRCSIHEDAQGAALELWLPLRAPLAGETPLPPP